VGKWGHSPKKKGVKKYIKCIRHSEKANRRGRSKEENFFWSVKGGGRYLEGCCWGEGRLKGMEELFTVEWI